MGDQNDKRLAEIWLPSALISLVVFGVYWTTLGFGLVDYDDKVYITTNPHVLEGLSFQNIGWAFSTFYASNWHPLTWLSLQLDTLFFGSGGGGYHFINLSLHLIAALLVLRFLYRITTNLLASTLVALLFAVHPTHVESVAWVSERKDLLCAVFWMACLLAYNRYTLNKSKKNYAWLTFFFVLGLLSKPMMVTLPLILLLVDYWPLKRKLTRDLITEKIPLFGLSIVSCVITLVAQSSTNATRPLVPLLYRLQLVPVSYVRYLGKLFLPIGLSAFYPFGELPWYLVLSSIIFLMAVTTVVIRSRNRPYLFMGWLWYLITLLPVIGLIQVGDQAMADRYTYLPSIGIFIAVSWLSVEIGTTKIRNRQTLASLCSLPLFILALLASRQVFSWQNTEMLWKHALESNPENATALVNLAGYYGEQGKAEEAEAYSRKGLDIVSQCGSNCFRYGRNTQELLWNNLGASFHMRRMYREAIEPFSQALLIDPDANRTRSMLINCLMSEHDFSLVAQHIVYVLDRNSVSGSLNPWTKLAGDLEKEGEIEGSLAILQAISRSYARRLAYAEAAETTKQALATVQKHHLPASRYQEMLSSYQAMLTPENR